MITACFHSRSESPSQVFVFLVNVLLKKLKNIPPRDWSKIFIAYDNICNVDRMKVARQELPLPHPFSQVWQSVSKIIDSFHLRNHKRPECHQQYNPKSLKVVHPNYNTQACEQTFAWLGRFHRILSSVPKVHNHFSYTDLSSAVIFTTPVYLYLYILCMLVYTRVYSCILVYTHVLRNS